MGFLDQLVKRIDEKVLDRLDLRRLQPGADEVEAEADATRARKERLVLVGIGLGALLVLVGTVTASVDHPLAYRIGMLGVAAGLLLTALGMVLSHPLTRLRTLGPRLAAPKDAQLRQWTHLKVLGMVFSILTLLALFALIMSLLYRLDPVEIDAPVTTLVRLTMLIGLVLVLFHAACHFLAVRPPMERPAVAGMDALPVHLGIAGSIVFALLAAVSSQVPLQLGGLVSMRVSDAPFFMVASATLASIALFVSKSVPTLHVLFADEKQYYSGDTYLSRRKSVLMPAVMALAFLFFVVLMMLLLGVGVAGIVEEVPSNSLLIGVIVAVGVALVALAGFAIRLQRTEDKLPFYRPGQSAEARRTMLIVAGSAVAAAILAVLTLMTFVGEDPLGLGQARWVDLLSVAILAALGPYGFHVAQRRRRIRKLEERFPDFLRDLAASRKAGLTLSASVATAARGDYGALTPEIRRMADQLTWNVPFEEALKRFGERVRTPLVERAVSLILEASRSGGKITDVLLAVANDARDIKVLQSQRATTMGLYTMIIYISFFVFLSVVAVMAGTFIPVLLESTTQAAARGGGGAGISNSGMTLNKFREFYFLAALVQGTGNGIVAGAMGSGRPDEGLRHSFLMVLVSLVTFLLVVAPE